MSWLLDIDYSLLLFINEMHSPFWDKVMVLFTKSLPWIPLYLAITAAIIYQYGYKKGNYLVAIYIVLGAILTFAITDMGSSFIKKVVMRERPGWDPLTMEVIRLLDGRGGKYGFISSHAANVFGLATFTSLYLKNRYYRYSIFIWATTVSYSRVYVGRHFPSDIICGALFGVLAALFIGKILYRVIKNRV